MGTSHPAAQTPGTHSTHPKDPSTSSTLPNSSHNRFSALMTDFVDLSVEEFEVNPPIRGEQPTSSLPVMSHGPSHPPAHATEPSPIPTPNTGWVHAPKSHNNRDILLTTQTQIVSTPNASPEDYGEHIITTQARDFSDPPGESQQYRKGDPSGNNSLCIH